MVDEIKGNSFYVFIVMIIKLKIKDYFVFEVRLGYVLFFNIKVIISCV